MTPTSVSPSFHVLPTTSYTCTYETHQLTSSYSRQRLPRAPMRLHRPRRQHHDPRLRNLHLGERWKIRQRYVSVSPLPPSTTLTPCYSDAEELVRECGFNAPATPSGVRPNGPMNSAAPRPDGQGNPGNGQGGPGTGQAPPRATTPAQVDNHGRPGCVTGTTGIRKGRLTATTMFPRRPGGPRLRDS